MSLVLLIEPDRVLSKTYAAALKKSSLDVKAVGSAQAAINSADKRTPDIVVVEIQLIGHSGFEFLYEFRSYKEWQTVPVLLLTSVPPQEFDGNQLLLERELGVGAYLYKPNTSLEKLIATVKELVK